MPDASEGPTFSGLDWLVLALYGVVLLVTGWVLNRRSAKHTSEYFLAGRSMPTWAVAVSVVATATSTATFIGGPEESYVRDLSYLSSFVGAFLGVAVVAFVFIPAFYRHGVTTVYELLERRFGARARSWASGMFMVGRMFASGARVYVAALPASMILFGDLEPMHLIVAIAGVCVLGVLYTLGGGIRAIIWGDCVQTAVFLGAGIAAAALLLHRIPIGVSEIVSVLGAKHGAHAGGAPDGSKLTVFRLGLGSAGERGGDAGVLGFDPAQPYTVLTALFGFSLLFIAAYGTDHDLTQRMLTCKSAARGSRSAVYAIVMNAAVAALFLGVGLLLFVYYKMPGVMGEARASGAAVPPSTALPPPGREVFLHFILTELPAGLRGLMMAGVMAVSIGSLNSALNAMSATFVNDFYRPARAGRSDAHYLAAGKAAVVGWGVVLGAFACACVLIAHGSGGTPGSRGDGGGGATIIEFVLGAMTFAYAGLLGVFLTAMLTRRGTQRSAIAALLVGFAAVGAMQARAWGLIPTEWAQGVSRFMTFAFAWKLAIAAGLSTLVCAWPRGQGRRGESEERYTPVDA